MDDRAIKRRKLSSNVTIVDTPPAPSLTPLQKLAFELYNACIEKKGQDGEFSTIDLQSYGKTKDSEELLKACQELVRMHMFIPYQRRNGGLTYQLRRRQIALKLGNLSSNDYVILYSLIAGTGRSGMWKKTLVQRSNMHENTITKGLKELMNKDLIKEFKTAKNPTKRMYILFNLEPTEESTGGNFYKDGELDEGLVNALSDFVVDYVRRVSWAEVSKVHGVKTKDGKRKSKERQSASHESQPFTTASDGQKFLVSTTTRGILVPRPPSFKDYPDAQNILEHVNRSQLLKELTLNISDVNQLIKTLILDNRLEEVSEGCYRAVRRVWKDELAKIDAETASLVGPVEQDEDGIGPGTGLTEIPCGRCPVSQDCRIGGKISPDNCQYMATWLNF